MVRRARWRNRLGAILALGGLLHLLVLAPATDAEPAPSGPCILVLGAMPLEIGPILDRTTRSGPAVTIDGRRFYPGRLMGRDVVLAMTGIGLENAEQATRAAFSGFPCIRGVVFSGVAGGEWIGDVVVPERWTEDGETFLPVDPRMQAAARRASADHRLTLERNTPLGDPACVCDLPRAINAATVQHEPEVVFGGDGITSDPFGGERLPCVPGAGDILGCDPCGELQQLLPDGAALGRLLTSNFLAGLASTSLATDRRYTSQDMETARTAAVAAEHGVPFIAFRAVSDGQGDPYQLPGFPVQFALYRQLAADNAAIATVAFLEMFTP
jgi:nucleoside phosphorylase